MQEVTFTVELPDQLAHYIEQRREKTDVILEVGDERRDLPTAESEVGE
jgi:hypothetical protein